ncbi:FAD-binding oxidoreductase [Candidatus Thorarchaeota archaeon]|nr:MAG: FAD-binding oxidoreductase [Candidatus Thorarchaeota archaeon]
MNQTMKDAMIQITGNDRVSDEENVLSQYSGNYPPSLVVWPITTEEVVNIVKWANENSVALVPTSSLGPKLRGSSLPKVENAIVVDLSKMNQILRIDSTNKVAMIEPGVTYDELIHTLKLAGLRPLMPFLPKGSKSVLASCLDREPITIPRFHWDTPDPLLCTETVFGTGDIFRTGAAAGPGTLEEQWEAGQAQKNPMGPSQFDPYRLVQGAQGTIGIVTWISMKCEKLPEIQKFFLAQADDLGDFQEFNYALFRRRLPDEHFMLNSTALSAALGEKKLLSPWILILGVSGHGDIADEELDYRIGDIKDIARESNVKLEENLKDVKSSEIEALLNRASEVPYWKIRAKGECQEVMFTTTLDRVQEFYHVFHEVAREIGFPLDQIGAYVQPMNQGTNTHVGFDLYYTLGEDDSTEKVIMLLSRGQKKLLDEGAYFSRPYGVIIDAVFEKGSPLTVDAMKRVKSIFDPNNILNPGTLCFKEVP